LFDDAGHPMIATHATKNRVRYNYYVSQPHMRGGAATPAGTITRVPAADVESAVSKALAVNLKETQSVDREALARKVARIEVRKQQLIVTLKPNVANQSNEERDDARIGGSETPSAADQTLLIPWCKPPSRKAREILLPASVSRNQIRPIKPERRMAIVKSIARGRAWLDELLSGTATDISQIAACNKYTVRHVQMTISMAFIAPDLVNAAIEGRLPRGISVASLRDAPAEWSLQRQRLGLAKAD
jgi:hypothetical protein